MNKKHQIRVSIGAMIKRAQELDLISDDQAKNLWMNHARRGWKKMEPLDESLQPETASAKHEKNSVQSK
jgi:Zn-dependent peptidase ImmA (M78 family)